MANGGKTDNGKVSSSESFRIYRLYFKCDIVLTSCSYDVLCVVAEKHA